MTSLPLRCETFRRLIEQPKRRVAKEQACKRQTTGLAARKTEPAFTERCAEPFRQSLDIRKQPRGDKRFAQFRVARLRLGEPQIAFERILKEFGPLRQKRRIDACSSPKARLHFICEQRQHCRFSGTARADDGQCFTQPQFQADCMERISGGAVMSNAYLLQTKSDTGFRGTSFLSQRLFSQARTDPLGCD
ncbi:hypothetical protein AJ87_43765 [Rhizobium yanglingense]|nr:hypothetical protein AJ87_43765 [Rhizobium yanglingense]